MVTTRPYWRTADDHRPLHHALGHDPGWSAAVHLGSRRSARVYGAEKPQSWLLLQYTKWSRVFFWGRLQIIDRGSIAPSTSSARVDAATHAQRHERSRRSLSRCQHGVRGRGAAVTYLACCSSFQACGNVVPSLTGTVHSAGHHIMMRRWTPVPCRSTEAGEQAGQWASCTARQDTMPIHPRQPWIGLRKK